MSDEKTGNDQALKVGGEDNTLKESLEKELKKYKELAENYKIRAEKAEKQAKKEPESSKEDKAENQGQPYEDKIARLEMKIQGYSDDEIDIINELGGVKSLNNPVVKKAVEVFREEREKAKALNIEGVGGSGSAREYSPNEIANMSAEEYRKKVLKN